MRVSKKVYLVVGITLFMIGGTTVFAGSKISPDNAAISQVKASATTKEIPAARATPTETSKDDAIVTEATPAPAPFPKYAEDPNDPGSYIVYDKVAVMNEAGIPADQQADADALISRVSGWRYGHRLSLCRLNGGPEGVLPDDLRSLQSRTGADVFTNPVTQLKWCTQMLSSMHMTWATYLKDYLHQ